MASHPSMVRARERARAEGKCAECRLLPVKPGCSTCARCLERREARRVKRRAAGLCRCGRVPAPGLKHCETCLAAFAARSALQVAVAKSQGMCVACLTTPAVPGKSMCQPHLDRNAAYQRAGYNRRRGR